MAEVGNEFAMATWQVNFDGLVIDHGPFSFLSSGNFLVLIQHIDGKVSIELQVQLGDLTGQLKLNVLLHNLYFVGQLVGADSLNIAEIRRQ